MILAGFLLAGGNGSMVFERGEGGMAPQAAILPSEIRDWKAVEDGRYDPGTIFDYLDGGGEVYLSYNMKSLQARRFRAEGKPDIIVDFFDMGGAEDAFGVFTFDRDGGDVEIGQGSVYKGGLLSFWKGRYFVSVYAEEETEETKSAVLDLGRAISSRIEETGSEPGILALLPAEGLDIRSIRFFHSHHILNRHFHLSEENILDLDRRTSAVLADYGGGLSSGPLLLLAIYPKPSEAGGALKKFRQNYLDPMAGGNPVGMDRNGTWSGAVARRNLLAVVFRAPDRAAAEILLGNFPESAHP